jgi:hypothetical protein
MGWQRGYYYRARKINGRVVREYVGAGRVAELAAQADARERERRRGETDRRRQTRADLDALDAELKALAEAADLAAGAALLAAGYHQHKRGEWRRRRDHDRPAG